MNIDKRILLKLCEEAREQAETDTNSNYYENVYRLIEEYSKKNDKRRN